MPVCLLHDFELDVSCCVRKTPLIMAKMEDMPKKHHPYRHFAQKSASFTFWFLLHTFFAYFDEFGLKLVLKCLEKVALGHVRQVVLKLNINILNFLFQHEMVTQGNTGFSREFPFEF